MNEWKTRTRGRASEQERAKKRPDGEDLGPCVAIPPWRLCPWAKPLPDLIGVVGLWVHGGCTSPPPWKVGMAVRLTPSNSI